MVHCNAVAADRELLQLQLQLQLALCSRTAAAATTSGKSWMSPTIGLFRLRLH